MSRRTNPETKLWFSKFCWADWRSDSRLRACSIGTRGVWIEILAIAFEGEPRGYVLVNGRAPTVKMLASLIAVPERETAKAIAELEGNGVLSRTAEGVIFSRRMVRDEAARDRGRLDGVKGGNPALRKPAIKPHGLTPSVNPSTLEGLTRRVNHGDILKSLEVDSVLRTAEPPIEMTPKGAAFTEALAGVRQLRVPGKDLRALVGRLVKEAGGDTTIVVDAIRRTLVDPPADPDVRGWLIGCCREGARRTKRGPTPNDSADAWSSLADRVSPDTDMPDGPLHAWCNGWAIDVVAGEVCDAAGIPWTHSDWRPLRDWLLDDIGADRILPAIRRMAARPGYEPPGSLKFFDKAVRANLRAA